MTTPHTAPAPEAEPLRPGWPEVVLGLLGMAISVVVLVFLGPVGLDPDPLVYGLIVSAWSGVGGLVGFGVAYAVRPRSLAAFGVRRTTWRWMLAGAGWGLVALLVKGLVVLGITTLTGYDSDPQGVYHETAGGGAVALALTFLFLAVLTPIGEELLFRGVVANALLRFGPWVGVLGSSAIFAVFHGVNVILPAAFVVGWSRPR
ncbi:CPBP family intramembrane glutamic endopeptidase [Nocardiopsis sp. NPDC006938]|uniref:CPBP family intramembrane glutamic endopeptidase n=1 Tax=Nocardiopsis sp. NPDC006938 TaxID=3364337 RepID=UPI0036837E40